MNQIEENIVHSFKLVKRDIIQLQQQVIEISQAQKQIVDALEALRSHDAWVEQQLQGVQTRTVNVVTAPAKRARKKWVASKTATKFHSPNCPFAQNIKPKSKVVFGTKTSALNAGLKPCDCVR
ncbi:MAG: hypothetical protein ABIH34_05355 [Nanoarchaeota archaeon]